MIGEQAPHDGVRHLVPGGEPDVARGAERAVGEGGIGREEDPIAQRARPAHRIHRRAVRAGPEGAGQRDVVAGPAVAGVRREQAVGRLAAGERDVGVGQVPLPRGGVHPLEGEGGGARRERPRRVDEAVHRALLRRVSAEAAVHARRDPAAGRVGRPGRRSRRESGPPASARGLGQREGGVPALGAEGHVPLVQRADGRDVGGVGEAQHQPDQVERRIHADGGPAEREGGGPRRQLGAAGRQDRGRGRAWRRRISAGTVVCR